MCTYCNMGDHTFRWDQPWRPDQYPQWPPSIPQPVAPAVAIPWDLQRLIEYRDLLKEIRDLEAQVCPSEPNKADYIGLLEKRIAHLKKQPPTP